MLEDFVYFSTLLLSITLGSYYKRIDDINVKRHYGMVLGIFIAFLICGHHFYHTILMVWSNIIILKCCDRRYVHKISLVYTWLHLMYMHINIINAPYVILLHQNIALRLVGIAFEIYTTDRQYLKPKPTSTLRISSGDTESVLEPTAANIFAYAFYFIGLHKGPYYRYRIFDEHLRGPFSTLGDFRVITEHKLKKVLICLVAYSFLRMKYTTQIYYDSKFYEYDTETRYLYNVPLLLMFLIKSVVIMLFCSCVCTEAGFGVYPAKTMPMPGHGPSTRYSLLNMTAEEALQHEYNFSMLKCYDNEKLLIGPRMKDTIRSWDMPVRYWFWMNIYKNTLKTNEEMRSACSYIAWTLWSGVSLQTIIISSTLWVYVHLETEYSEMYNTGGQMKIPWNIGFSIMRMFCLIYLTPCFIVNDTATILRYYNSIFWVFHGVLLVLTVGAVVTYKSR